MTAARHFESENNLRLYAGMTPAFPDGMRSSKSFRDLRVWQESMLLVEEVYALTRGFPPDERFCLTAQLRRAAVSIPSNIGEGARRRRGGSFRWFLRVALGSQGELEVQLEIAFRLTYCSSSDYQRLMRRTSDVGRMLTGLLASQKETR